MRQEGAGRTEAQSCDAGISEERATMTKKSFKKFFKMPRGWGWCGFQTIIAHFSRIHLYEGQ